LHSLTRRLRERTAIPLALGEDRVGRWAFADLLEEGVVDVLRVDATTIGGLSEAVKVCAMASSRGVPVSTHVFPEVHGHLGAALPAVLCVEMTDPSQNIDPFWRLLRSRTFVSDGWLDAPSDAGLGVDIDWDAQERFGARPSELRE
ncbi:MAG: enolase C-terminal domain-like protein, partial [Fimbriimonadales bacterium]